MPRSLALGRFGFGALLAVPLKDLLLFATCGPLLDDCGTTLDCGSCPEL